MEARSVRVQTSSEGKLASPHLSFQGASEFSGEAVSIQEGKEGETFQEGKE